MKMSATFLFSNIRNNLKYELGISGKNTIRKTISLR
jgi:hypothetical protein